MIYIFWPNKSIPEWLEKIEFHGIAKQNIPGPEISHQGYGIVFSVRQHHVAWLAQGYFMRIYGGGMNVHVKGGGKEVFLNSSFKRCLAEIVDILNRTRP